MKRLALLCMAVFLALGMRAQEYKAMMSDPQFTIQEVKASAEAWFEEHGNGEGSGFKGYQRWLRANEYKYPDGRRDNVDPYFLEKEWSKIESSLSVQSSGGWQELGPYTIDSITGHYSPGLGRVECFYVDTADTDFLYLGSRSGGFWKSTDGGVNWLSSTTDFLPASGVNTMSVNPHHRDSVLINLRNARNGTSQGIYRSTDGGLSWTLTDFNPSNVSWTGLGENGQVYQIAYHPEIPGRVYIGTNRGLYISNDDLSSSNWTLVESSFDITHIKFHPTDTSVVYVYDDYYWGANGDVIMISQDGGLTFTASATLSGNNGANVEIAVSPACPDCLYAGSPNGVWKSVDKGQNFQFMSNPSGTCDGFAVSDQDTSVMIYGMLDIFQSIDGGASFNQVTWWFINGARPFNNNQYVHADLREIQAFNGDFYIGTDGYLAKSSGAGTAWTRLSRGTGIRENYSIAIAQSDPYTTVAGSQDNGTSIYRKEGWVEFYGADGMEAMVHPLNSDWLMGSVQYGSRRLSFDGGRSQRAATPSGQTGGWEAPLDRNSLDHLTLYHFGDLVYESNDYGLNWTQIGAPLFNGTISRAAMAPNDPDVIAVSRGANLDISINGGQTFRRKRTGLPNSTITDISFAPHSDSIILVTFATYQNNGSKIWMTTDQGNSWTNITSNLGDMPLRCVVMDDSPDHNIYVGAEIGVYVKALNANNWSLYNTNLPNVAVEDLEIMHGANLLRAATWGRGMWQAPLKDRGTYPRIENIRAETPPHFWAPTDAMPQDVFAGIAYGGNIDTVYLRWSANSLALDSIIGMVYTQDSIWKTARPIPNQSLSSNVYFKVFAVGDQMDTSFTFRFHYEIQDTGFCKAGDPNTFTTKYIEEVILSNMQAYGGRAAYTDYTNLYANLNANQTYNMSVLVTGAGSEDVVRGWIDYNKDSVFAESEELSFTAIDPTNFAYATITAPNLGYTDTVRMRVRVIDSNLAADPCNYYDGEAEDFSVVLIGNNFSIAKSDLNWPRIYPNPARDYLKVDEIDLLQFPRYRILDMKGTVLLEAESAELKDRISLEGLAPGAYIIEWDHESGSQKAFNFIKQ